MKAPQLSVVAIALFFVGCHYYPRDTGVPAAPPCPNPNVDMSRWTSVTASECAVGLKLPEGYKFIGGSGYFGTREWVTNVYDFGEFEFVEFAFFPNGFTSVKKQKAPEDAEGHQQCLEKINDHTVAIESYRSREYAGNPGRLIKTYSVLAELEVENGTAQIVSQNVEPVAQRQILAAIRTIEVIPRAPRPASKELSRAAVLFILLRQFAIPWAEYFAVLAVGGYLIFRRKARRRNLSAWTRRLAVAAYFALLLTPGVITEFSILQYPRPALFDFFTFLPSLFYVDVAGQIWLEPFAHLVRIMLCFALVYGALTIYVRLRAWRRASSG
jgi:hypothetical protein